jgi:hypothetical protein
MFSLFSYKGLKNLPSSLLISCIIIKKIYILYYREKVSKVIVLTRRG